MRLDYQGVHLETILDAVDENTAASLPQMWQREVVSSVVHHVRTLSRLPPGL